MTKLNFTFSVAPEVLALGVTGVYLLIRGLHNRISDPDFDAHKMALWEKLKTTYSGDFVKKDPILQGFRDLHARVGRSNKTYPASPENLIKMLLRKGTISPINLVADIYNCVSLETRLALGAHDLEKIVGNVRLAITKGTETFVPLGKGDPQPVGAGEYAYVDDSNEIICRLEHRQVEKTKVTLETKTCFYIIQGNPNTSLDYLMAAMHKLVEITKGYCGGEETLLWAHKHEVVF